MGAVARAWVKLTNWVVGKTNRQRSCPLQITSPPSRSGRNFAGRASRPLSSRRGVWVPRNNIGATSTQDRDYVSPPLVPTITHFTPPANHCVGELCPLRYRSAVPMRRGVGNTRRLKVTHRRV